MFPQPVRERDINVTSKKSLKGFIMDFTYNIPGRESNVSALLGGWVDQILTEDEYIVLRTGSRVETLKIKYND
jgi:hypothetical protein